MGEKEKPRLWTGLLCTTDNRASGWQADHGRIRKSRSICLQEGLR